MNAAVKIIQKITPVLKNGIFILILCQLIVDIRKPDRLGITFILHSADPVPRHFFIGNSLLRGQPLFIFFAGRLFRLLLLLFRLLFLLFSGLFYHFSFFPAFSSLLQAPSSNLFSCQSASPLPFLISRQDLFLLKRSPSHTSFPFHIF